MKTIDDILKEQGFSPKEKAAFLEMLSDAKRLQNSFMLDDLKNTLSTIINKVVKP